VRYEAADIVQQTLAEAHRGYPAFRGTTEPEFLAWIKQIHRHNVTDLLRKSHRIAAEGASLDWHLFTDDSEATDSFFWCELASDDTTVSQRMVKGEEALRLAGLLQSLPEMQREAVRLRHLEGWPVERIARELDRTVAATAGLIKRGLQELRQQMSEDSWF
jgi:RNA polymerase sigma-70 factor (ECF subfamily)